MGVELRYCTFCGVVVELHPSEKQPDVPSWECGVAERKADMLAAWLRVRVADRDGE